jgi:hypothetical protein
MTGGPADETLPLEGPSAWRPAPPSADETPTLRAGGLGGGPNDPTLQLRDPVRGGGPGAGAEDPTLPMDPFAWTSPAQQGAEAPTLATPSHSAVSAANSPNEPLLIGSFSEPATPPSDERPEVDPALDAICLKCLEKDPADRYATAGGLARDLAHYLTVGPERFAHLELESPDEPHEAGQIEPQPSRAPRPSSQPPPQGAAGPWRWIGLLALLLVGLVALHLLMKNRATSAAAPSEAGEPRRSPRKDPRFNDPILWGSQGYLVHPRIAVPHDSKTPCHSPARVHADLELTEVAVEYPEYLAGERIVFAFTLQNTGAEALHVARVVSQDMDWVLGVVDCTLERLGPDSTLSPPTTGNPRNSTYWYHGQEFRQEGRRLLLLSAKPLDGPQWIEPDASLTWAYPTSGTGSFQPGTYRFTVTYRVAPPYQVLPDPPVAEDGLASAPPQSASVEFTILALEGEHAVEYNRLQQRRIDERLTEVEYQRELQRILEALPR